MTPLFFFIQSDFHNHALCVRGFVPESDSLCNSPNNGQNLVSFRLHCLCYMCPAISTHLILPWHTHTHTHTHIDIRHIFQPHYGLSMHRRIQTYIYALTNTFICMNPSVFLCFNAVPSCGPTNVSAFATTLQQHSGPLVWSSRTRPEWLILGYKVHSLKLSWQKWLIKWIH